MYRLLLAVAVVVVAILTFAGSHAVSEQITLSQVAINEYRAFKAGRLSKSQSPMSSIRAAAESSCGACIADADCASGQICCPAGCAAGKLKCVPNSTCP
jgi:hypothetical protein